jgi:hypothetical protein
MAPPEIKAAFGFNRSGSTAVGGLWVRGLRIGSESLDGKRLTEPGWGCEVTTPVMMLPACCPTRSGVSEWLKEKTGRPVQKTEEPEDICCFSLS